MQLKNTTAQLNSERAVTEILSNFDTNFIMDVMEDSLRFKFRPYNTGGINFANVIERDLNIAVMTNPSYKDKIDNVKMETHREIIDMICRHYNLSFVGEQTDLYTSDRLYSVSSMMYSIFVSDFTANMIKMFVSYILRNVDYLYNIIDVSEESKKNKDFNAYSKKMYVNSKLVAIHSCMDQVLDHIASLDMSLPVLLQYLTDPDTGNFLASILVDNNDIYKYHYASYIINPVTKPDMFTAIKLTLQQYAAHVHPVVDFVQKETPNE